jgi:hypothetical protein
MVERIERDREAGPVPVVVLPEERPGRHWIRGACKVCGGDVVSNFYFVTLKDGTRGYIIVWECRGSLAEHPTCDFRRIL